jgi:DNA mismatch repair protein MutL
VHPTKHEVRFRNPRQVHDFLVKLVEQCLQQGTLLQSEAQSFALGEQQDSQMRHRTEKETASSLETSVTQRFPQTTSKANRGFRGTQLSKGQIAEQQYVYQALSQPLTEGSDRPESTDVQLSCLWKGRFWLKPETNGLWIIDCWRWCLQELEEQWMIPQMQSKPLLLPQMISVAQPQAFEDAEVFDSFQALGIDLTPAGPNRLMLRKLPIVSVPVTAQLWLQALQGLLQGSVKCFAPQAVKQALLSYFAKVPLSDAEFSAGLHQWASRHVSDNRWQSHACRLSESQILQLIDRRIGEPDNVDP